MSCVILQPSFIPWRGYFHQMWLADTFVFYDDVQYDARGWRNRNRIKTAQGTRWVTVPVHGRGAQEGLRIDEVAIDWEQGWSRKLLTSLRHAYGRAPFFDRYLPVLEARLAARPPLLADLTIDLTIALGRELGIERTRYLRASSLQVEGAKTERLLAILRRVGAERYISGPSARDYLDVALLERHGISVEFMTYDYPEYEQLHPPFDAKVSILDLLFMQGPDAGRLIWGGGPPPPP